MIILKVLGVIGVTIICIWGLLIVVGLIDPLFSYIEEEEKNNIAP